MQADQHVIQSHSIMMTHAVLMHHMYSHKQVLLYSGQQTTAQRCRIIHFDMGKGADTSAAACNGNIQVVQQHNAGISNSL